MPKKVQSLIFSKKKSPSDVNGGAGWKVASAKKWAKDHDFKADKVDEPAAGETIRLRQFPPGRCTGGHQTLTKNFPPGISAVSCDVAEGASRGFPEPERLRVRMQLAEKPKRKGDVWVFRSLAQIYNRVNDHLMIFRFGSGTKTIAERVPAGRVTILRGHPFIHDDRFAVGKVLAAEESQGDGGLVYDGMISKTEETLVEKMAEGIIDENSMEIHTLREGVAEVPPDQIPEHARRFARLAPSGLAEVREVQEFMWLAVGLLASDSSQGIEAVIEAPRLVPFADLPVAASSGVAWDSSGARERVLAWAGSQESSATFARLSRAFLARGNPLTQDGTPSFVLQVADVVDDQLVVLPEALENAFAHLEERLADDPATLAAAAISLGRYQEKLLTADPIVVEDREDEPETPGAPVTPPASEVTEITPPDSVASDDDPPTETESETTDVSLSAWRKRIEGLRRDLTEP